MGIIAAAARGRALQRDHRLIIEAWVRLDRECNALFDDDARPRILFERAMNAAMAEEQAWRVAECIEARCREKPIAGARFWMVYWYMHPRYVENVVDAAALRPSFLLCSALRKVMPKVARTEELKAAGGVSYACIGPADHPLPDMTGLAVRPWD